MNKSHKYFLGIYYRIVDLIALNIAFFLGVFIRFRNEYTDELVESRYLTLLIFINLSWVILSHTQKIYNIFSFSSKKRYFLRVALAVISLLILAIGFNGLLKAFYSRLFLLYTFIGFGTLMLLGRMAINSIYKIYLDKKTSQNTIVLFGDNFSMTDIEFFLREDSIDSDFQNIEVVKDISNCINVLEQLKKEAPVSEIYTCLSTMSEELMEELSAYCDNNFIRLRLVVDWQKIAPKQIASKKIGHTMVLNVPLTPLDDPYNTLLKRTFDIIFSSIVIVTIFSWLFPILAIIIKLTSKGPIFFKQKRTGLDNKDFYCWKFRSMEINEEADTLQATKEDERITKIGKVIRGTSLDEFPQFFNVFKGEMSVVGPRPHMLKHTEEYSKLSDNFMNRHAIKPGITGLAQIKGYRGEIDETHLLINRIRLDRFYVNNWSLYLDLKIVFLTVFTIFKEHK